MIRRMVSNRAVQILAVVVVLAAAAVAWLAYSALKVKGDLESVRTDAGQARTLMLDGDQAGARAAAESAAARAEDASERSHGLLWSAVAAVPALGSPLKSVQQMSDAVESLSADVLVPAADLASVLDPDQLRTGNTVNLELLRDAQPALQSVAEKSAAVAEQVSSINPSWLGVVADAKTQLADQVDAADSTVQATNIAAQLVPSMLGSTGPRNYFMAFQTPSEARGTGGLVGGFAVLRAADGRVTIPELGANSEFRDPATPTINLGPEYDAIYSYYKPYTDFRNGNLSADFTDAAQIWIANWRAQTGQRLDGAIALDPIALKYVLEVVGTVTLPDGEKITADNVVPITLSTAYQRYATDNEARKDYLQNISGAVVKKLITSGGSTRKLLEALGRGVHERRIMVYSTTGEEQKILETTNLGHQISDTTSPYLQVAIGNASGTKLDYYLRRDISYTSGPCTGDTRESTITVKLTNTLDTTDLTDYVAGGLGTDLSVNKGTNLANVEFLTTKGAVLKEMTLGEGGAFYVEQTLHDRPYYSTRVGIPPGQTVTITLKIDEPTTAKGEAEVPIQPLVDDPTVKVDVPACGAED
ncbi:DUF4012 domain-containing protein [Gordonia jinghuaiqii]|uniref:DUF4012 domain-containing protein n=1 Tax=Gordonia jinghuaiqii TaxID=2758710 RepID=A0A7D7R452_9ACTN|nr:DUF4012 domain-containing protein [Gordonia jinghuaiqii]MCR5977815.1 DUF4012 domain-containing protein [Gordonia jinghuaiqii]QMT02472.1 DUF4012 domain-containing protein [Gordonia jinghuaiqii]